MRGSKQTSLNSKRRRTYNIDGNIFFCPKRFAPMKCLGKGSYGLVVSAKDKVKKSMCAIKRIAPLSKTTLDTKHILREIRLMRWLGSRHENILTLRDLYLYPGHDEIYLVLPLFDTDLHRVIQSKQKLSPAHVAHFMRQILSGIDFIHRAGVLHRDLKPGNLLVNRDCHLVLADFGLARVKESRDNRPMTHHVVTRWYRPPELILNPDGMYGTAVDVWSVGCIFAELLGRKPLFPGKDQVHQLQLIFQTLGSPEKSQMGHIRNSDGRRFLRSLPWYAAKHFRDVYPNVKSKHAIELLTMFLKFVPNDRVTVLEALNHAYVSSFENIISHKHSSRHNEKIYIKHHNRYFGDSKSTKKHDTSVVSPPSPEFMSFETCDGMSRDDLLGMVTEEIRYFRELRRGIRNLDMNLTAQKKRSRGVVNDLRAKAAAARSTAIIPEAAKQKQSTEPQKKPPLRPKRFVQVEKVGEEKVTKTPPPPRDPPPPVAEKNEGSLSPSARELRRISKSFESGAIDLEQKRALKQKLIRAVSPRHHSSSNDHVVQQDEKTSDVDSRRKMKMSRKKKKCTVVRPFRFATTARRRRQRSGGVVDTKKKKDIVEKRKSRTRKIGNTPPIPRPTTGDSKTVFDEEEDEVGSSGDYTEVN